MVPRLSPKVVFGLSVMVIHARPKRGIVAVKAPCPFASPCGKLCVAAGERKRYNKRWYLPRESAWRKECVMMKKMTRILVLVRRSGFVWSSSATER